MRQRRREARIQAGVDDLARWLKDLARAGLADMAARPWSTFEQMSARLVDAQAPGLARLVRDLGAIPHTEPNWPERMLISLGRLSLLVEAWLRLDRLDPDLRAEVRGLVGINESRDSVLAQPGLPDAWTVVGRRLLEGERIRVQRTWLWGAASRRWALILEFAAGGQRLDRTLLPGTSVEVELCFYSGVLPLRALLKTDPRLIQRPGEVATESITDMTRRFADWLGRHPWLERTPAILRQVTPLRTDDGTWCLVDDARRSIPLGGGDGWQLLAVSGSAPIDVAGEWDGYRFWPLSVTSEAGIVPMRELEVA